MEKVTHILTGFVGAFLYVAQSCVFALVTLEDYPFSPAPGELGSTAVFWDDVTIEGWATSVALYSPGAEVDRLWQVPEAALGPAEGDGISVVSLGRGGQIVLTFDRPISDGPGWDLAVFENGFGDSFLELGWVEVSSDGIHFVRFPNYSATANPVGAFGAMDTRKLYGYAGKYGAGYGTPFDLSELAEAYAVLDSQSPFSDAYAEHLRTQFPYLDLEAVSYVRIVDIVGSGMEESAARQPDGTGYPIYDPWPTLGSAGLDLDAVAVRHLRAQSNDTPFVWMPPLPNLWTGSQVTLPKPYSNREISVGIRLISAPTGTRYNADTQLLQIGNSSGRIVMEAFYEGDALHEPLVYQFDFAAVDSLEGGAPVSYAEWASIYGGIGLPEADPDGDGSSNYLEYLGGSDPLDFHQRPVEAFSKADGSFAIRWTRDKRTEGTLWLWMRGDQWQPILPDMVQLVAAEGNYETYTYNLKGSESDSVFFQLRGMPMRDF
jgi:hypothetical protein